MTTSSTTVTSLGSAYFDGTGDYLSLSSAIVPATGNFTIEFWIYSLTNAGSSQRAVYAQYSGGTSGRFMFGLDQTSASRIWLHYNGTDYVGTTNGILPNTWAHLALVRNGDVFTMYVNGVLNATNTFAGASVQQIAGNIGGMGGSFNVNARVSNLRIVVGTAQYTSNFLPPQTPLTPVANTQLLSLQYNGGANNNGFVDQSSFNNIITRTGNVTQGTFSPFSQNGWSNYFDGTGDQLTTGTNLSLSGAPYTIEMWIYTSTSLNTKNNPYLIVLGSSAQFIAYDHSDNPGSKLRISGGFGTISMSQNQWHHIALVNNTTDNKVYIDGVLDFTFSYMPTISNAVVTIGGWSGQGTEFNYAGYISNLRVSTEAVYTSAFTPPTTPLTATAKTVLLTCQNNRFTDNSKNSAAITTAGDVSVQSFSPFGGVTSVPTSYSNYFDGTGDYLSTVLGAPLDLTSTNPFTIEFWLYVPALPSVLGYVFHTTYAGTSTYCYVSSTGVILFGSSSGGTRSQSNSALSINTWYHVAICRSGGVERMFINGVAQTQTSGQLTHSLGTLYFGTDSSQTYFTNFYLSNFRIVKLTGLYSSNFTVPTAPLTAITNTSLLTCQSAKIVDNSTNNYAITVTGDSKPKSFNPFGTTNTTQVSYTPSVNGGSMYFDGTGDYLVAPAGSTIYGTMAYTIEFWIYKTSAADLTRLFETSTGTTDFSMDIGTTGYITINNNTTIAGSATAIPLALNTWTHVALVRTSTGANDTRWYINGTAAGAFTHSVNIASNVMQIGRSGGGYHLTGYLTDLRFVQNSTVYTSSFVPPVSPLLSTNQTTLLLNGTSGGIIDAHGTSNIETVGNTQLASEDPYSGSYYSNYFDGFGDYLTITEPAGSTSDMTMEFWLQPSNFAGSQIPVNNNNNASGAFAFQISTTGAISVYIHSFSAAVFTTTLRLNLGVWNHVALVRISNVYYCYINGVRDASTYTSASALGQGNYIVLGGYSLGGEVYTGYISNYRWVQGTALYSGTTLTMPTTPLTAISGTKVLTCQSNRFIDNSTNNFTITRSGDTKVKSINPFQQNTGKSLYFDGTGDWLSIPTNSNMMLNTGDFTIEGWVYKNATSTTMYLVDLRNAASSNMGIAVAVQNTGLVRYIYGATGNSVLASTTVVTEFQWVHIAVTRSNNTVKLFINGVQEATTANDTTNYNVNAPCLVGINISNTSPMNGYIKDLRITKGVARYATTFTPPATPLVAK